MIALTRLCRDLGTIRLATPADAPAVARFMSALDRDLLPLTTADVAAWSTRGSLLIVELRDGSLGGVALFSLERLRGAEYGMFRYLAVHPNLAASGIEQRLIDAMLVSCDRRPRAPGRAPWGSLRAMRDELSRRLAYVCMLVLSLPGLVGSAGRAPASTAIFVWSALALGSAATASRIPRAIARRRADARR